MAYDINSIDELIRTLGGASALADRLGIDQTAVSQWKMRGQIASGWHLRLEARLRRLGKSVNPAVYGLSEEEAEGLFPHGGKTRLTDGQTCAA